MFLLLVLIELAGSVALLLWATRMVQTGVQRAFGSPLKDFMRRALRTDMMATLSGGALAMALQSATAVAVIVTGFASAGLVAVPRGITALLGADLGSALVALILQFDLTLLAPVLVLTGFVAFKRAHHKRWQQVGRILIGIGLILFSLRAIGAAVRPLRESDVVPLVVEFISNDPFSLFGIAAMFAFLVHSSIASILVAVALASQGLVQMHAVVPIVLGINFGASFLPVVLTRGIAFPARLIPYGNLVARGGCAILFLVPLLHPAMSAAVAQALTERVGQASALIGAHLFFNACLVVIGLFLSKSIYAVLKHILGEGGETEEPAKRLSPLIDADLSVPSIAIANATREIVRTYGVIEGMLRDLPDLFCRSPEGVASLRSRDDDVDASHMSLKLYLSKIHEDELDELEIIRRDDILSAAIKLEQVADIISGSLAAKAIKKSNRKVSFSAPGCRELARIHSETLRSGQRALSVVLSGDVDMARELVARKEQMRYLEQESETSHMERLRSGNPQTLESSSLHVDTVRDLKEINSLFISIGYPVLERTGLLRASRLIGSPQALPE